MMPLPSKAYNRCTGAIYGTVHVCEVVELQLSSEKIDIVSELRKSFNQDFGEFALVFPANYLRASFYCLLVITVIDGREKKDESIFTHYEAVCK